MPSPATSRKVGLARALSKLGYCSRSQATSLIRAGRVRLNEKVRLDPETPVRIDKDRIKIDDSDLGPSSKIYLAMNKPRGLITTASDEKGRDTIYFLLDKSSPWLAPVGRLDKASEGLLLLTNDSEWSAKITTPETHVEKTYHVQISTVADNKLTEGLMNGITTEEGDELKALRAVLLRSGQKNSWLEIILDEGKNRQIRRMLAARNIEVLRLIRIAIGPVQLGKLAKGTHRPLTPDEKNALDRAMQGKPQ